MMKLIVAVVIALLLLVPCPGQPDTPWLRLGVGLEGKIEQIARDKRGSYVTVTYSLRNTGQSTFYLALVGAPPGGADSAGTHYSHSSSAGLAKCAAWNATDYCIGPTQRYGLQMSLQEFTQLDPGAQLTATATLYGSGPGTGPTMSFAATLAVRAVTDPVMDAASSEFQQRRQIRVMPMGFPPSIITESR